jgi:hypothetical protein
MLGSARAIDPSQDCHVICDGDLSQVEGGAMEPIIARCGNRCDLCPLFKENFTPEAAPAINDALYKYHCGGEGPRPQYSRACDGCLSDGHIARQACQIRVCVIEKGFSICARCPQMYCQLLEHDMAIIEGALSQHRTALPPTDFQMFFRPFLIREALARLSQQGPAE